MDAILFTLASGGSVAIDADEVSALWSGLEPGTTAIERMGYEGTIVVLGKCDKITEEIFGYTDMRPKKKRRTKADAKYHRPYASNLVALDDHRKKAP